MNFPTDGYVADVAFCIIKAGFSHYILSAPRVCDSLCCAEAWNYLKDTLLLILSQSFVADDEPLALIICPSICHALLQLLQLMEVQASKSFLNV
jgi:hypothetical protein